MTNNDVNETLSENETIQILQEKVQNSAKLGLELYDRLNESLSQLEATQQALWSAELDVQSLENRNSELLKVVDRLEKENIAISLEHDILPKDVITNSQSKNKFNGELEKALHEIEILHDQVQSLQLENIALTRHGCNSKLVKGSKVVKLNDDHHIHILQENNENITPSKNGAQPANYSKIFTPMNNHTQSSNPDSIKKRECRTPLTDLAPKNDWLKEKKELQRIICNYETRIASLEEELVYYRTAKQRTPSPQQLLGTPTTPPTRSGSSLAYELSQLLSSTGSTGHGEREGSGSPTTGSPTTNTITKTSIEGCPFQTPYNYTRNNSPTSTPLSPSCNGSITTPSNSSSNSSYCPSPTLQDLNASVNLLEHYHQQYHRLFERFRSPPAERFRSSSSVQEEIQLNNSGVIINHQENIISNSNSNNSNSNSNSMDEMIEYDSYCFHRDEIVFVLATIVLLGFFVMSLFIPLVFVSMLRGFLSLIL